MKSKICLLLATLILVNASAAGRSPEDRVVRVLKRTPLIDGHNDLPYQYRRRVANHVDQLDLEGNLKLLDPPTHTDIPRLREGMVGGQFWSVYVPILSYGGTPEDVALVAEQIDLVYRMVDRYPETFEIAYTADDVRRIHRRGRIASMIGMEGGHAINNSLAVLRQMFRLGARYMTLTHGKSLRWADSATGEARHGGLTPFGEEVVREMNRLGMMVDLSHVSPQTMTDALAVSEAPIIFSHSSAFGVVPHDRNVPDDMLRSVADNGGVVMVTFYPTYVSEQRRLHFVRAGELTAQWNQEMGEEQVAARMAEWWQANPAPSPTLSQVADHIDHIRATAGVSHIGLGGDYDGMPPGPVGLEDVSTYPALLVELLRRGYSDREIGMIAGGNVLRVMEAVEAVARKLQRERLPSDALIDELDGPVGPEPGQGG